MKQAGEFLNAISWRIMKYGFRRVVTDEPSLVLSPHLRASSGDIFYPQPSVRRLGKDPLKKSMP